MLFDFNALKPPKSLTFNVIVTYMYFDLKLTLDLLLWLKVEPVVNDLRMFLFCSS